MSKTTSKRRAQKHESTKPPSVKAAVIAKNVQGENKQKIAKDLQINWRTVDRILKDAELCSLVGVGKSQCHAMIPPSIDVHRRALAGDSMKYALQAAGKILTGTGVLRNGNGNGNQVHVGETTFTLVIADAGRAEQLLRTMALRGGGSELVGVDDAVHADAG